MPRGVFERKPRAVKTYVKAQEPVFITEIDRKAKTVTLGHVAKKPSTSHSYYIKKNSLYGYQICRFDTLTQKELLIQPENDFRVVASNLIDLLWKELTGGIK